MKLYDDDIDTTSQVVNDFIINKIKELPDFNQDQIYDSTLLIDEKTPLPCIGLYRNRIEPYEGNNKCIGKEKYSFDLGICYFTKPTTTQYFNNELYHFEEKVLMLMNKIINKSDYPKHSDYKYWDKRINIEDITFKSSNITTILTNGTNYNWGNMVRLIYTIDFSIDLFEIDGATVTINYGSGENG